MTLHIVGSFDQEPSALPEPIGPERLNLQSMPAGTSTVVLEIGDADQALAMLTSLEALPEQLSRAVVKRKVDYLAGRHAARLALSRIGCHGAVTRAADGSPVWPDQAVGSITHGAGLAAATVAATSTHLGIGIDVEAVMRPHTAADLKHRIATGDELSTLATGVSETLDLRLLLTLIFSLKESFYKCVNPLAGEFLGFSDVQLMRCERIGQNTVECELTTSAPKSLSLLPSGSVTGRVSWTNDRVASAVAVTRGSA